MQHKINSDNIRLSFITVEEEQLVKGDNLYQVSIIICFLSFG